MNKHKNHIANCLCCAFCKYEFEEYEGGDGNMTGEMLYSCKKNFWMWEPGDGANFDAVISQGTICASFLEKEWRLAINKQTGKKRLAQIVLIGNSDMVVFKEPSAVTTMPLFDNLWEWDLDSVLAEWYQAAPHPEKGLIEP